MKGLSRVIGNYHARFLGGLAAAMPPAYPTNVLSLFYSNLWLLTSGLSLLTGLIPDAIVKITGQSL
jgi:hypothetical protein